MDQPLCGAGREHLALCRGQCCHGAGLPPGSAEPWQPLIDASGHRSLFDALYPGGGEQQVLEFLIRAEANPNSIVNCIALARENARQIRDVITSEMWEQLNGLYWTLVENDGFWEEPTPEQLREIRRGCQLFYGITDATLSRDLSWQFSRLGRLIERADKTTRILDVKYFLCSRALMTSAGYSTSCSGCLYCAVLALIRCSGNPTLG